MVVLRGQRPAQKPLFRARDALRDFHSRGNWPFWRLKTISAKCGPRGPRRVYRARPPLGGDPLAIKVVARPEMAASDYDAMMAAHAFAPDLNVKPLHLDTERGAIIMPYFAEGTISRQIGTRDHDDMIAAAARWLRRFHYLSPFNQTQPFGEADPADWLKRTRPGRRKLRYYPRLQTALKRRKADLKGAPCQIVIGHNDFKAPNLVQTENGILSIDRSRNSKTIVETEIARFLFLLHRRYVNHARVAETADRRAARDREVFADFYGLSPDRQPHLDLALDRAAVNAWLCRKVSADPAPDLALLDREMIRIADAA